MNKDEDESARCISTGGARAIPRYQRRRKAKTQKKAREEEEEEKKRKTGRKIFNDFHSSRNVVRKRVASRLTYAA